MGLGLSNEVLALGMLLAGIRFLNIGLKGGDPSTTSADRRATYHKAVEAAKGLKAPSGDCLEICAGFGFSLPVIEGGGSWQVQGVDGGWVASMFARLNRLKVKYARIERMPFADQSFDHAIGVECVVCLDHPKPSMQEIARVLRPGGLLTIAEFRLGSLARAERVLGDLAAASGLSLLGITDLTKDARRSVLSGAGERAAFVRRIPPPFRNWAFELAAMPGSVRHREWDEGLRCYYIAQFQKPE